jgi:pimeloyl-ACP methyl ester carboxylesterase
MDLTINKHGNPPFKVVLTHGGPGAAGELTSLAKVLSTFTSILEPFQTKLTIEDLICELDEQISQYAEAPVIMAGHSWGAWLSLLYAARFNEKVNKLILISSGPFDAGHAVDIINVRVERLSEENKKKLFRWIERLNDPDEKNKNELFREVGELIYMADSFDPVEREYSDIKYDYDRYLQVWNEAQELRKSLELLNAVSRVNCPVVAIHGNYDPHPADGVRNPLAARLKDFKFHLIRNCGHHPWEEKMARDEFLSILSDCIVNP